MSHQKLASLLNDLSRKGQALITEGNSTLIVSDLPADAARSIAQAASAAAWAITLFDSAGGETEVEEGDEAFGPFRAELVKPLPQEHDKTAALYVVTEVGFRAFLDNGHPASRWYVLGLLKPFNTRARAYSDWGIEEPFVESQATKSPRLLVKESADVRTVPEDVRHWLLAEGHELDEADPLHLVWATQAFEALSRCFANEIDASGSKLSFKGPPKLNLTLPETVDGAAQITLNDFKVVQDAAVWVFDNAREAEVKHILLSAEIARSGRADGEAFQYFRANLEAALDCGKIAYQMAVSEITKDTLKSLGDLRKAVTEETSKATDATRQAIAAISTALTLGLGLIVARLTLQINPYLISLVMAVAFGYTTLNVMSGRKFINIQRKLRQDWQSKLYRFLSEAEFKKMVGDPIEQAESFFYRVSCQGLTMLCVVALGIAVFAFVYTTPPATTPSVPTALPAPATAPGSPQPPTNEPVPQPKSVPKQRYPAKPSEKREAPPVIFDQGIFAVRTGAKPQDWVV
ncbi:hypothetical protein KSS93_22385 [Pseudomonas xanthosomatis]|uniref:hypothetical protein n=1 Tax=Pseudomonas xanthosomatis TaxID=2842356 RepID=UPI001C3C6C79|nr:hypothetical protein [Pseudomonas xanthosomatis]QXH45596.1 hypothetical protein KSS93_22385 [Pseudomonas xanthosomatis]